MTPALLTVSDAGALTGPRRVAAPSDDASAIGDAELRALVANIAGMVYRGLAERPWCLQFVSQGVEALTGYPPDYFLKQGHRWAELILPEDLGTVVSTLSARAREGRDMRVEYRIRRRDGQVRWVDGRVRIVPGTPMRYEGTVFDIDDRKRAEHALAESQEHQRYILQCVPSTLWTAGPDGAIDFISQAGATYIGASAEQRRGHGWLEFVHPQDVERVRARWHESLASGELYEATFRQADLRGSYRWLHARAIARRDGEGRIVSWYGITTDASELVTAQEQLRASDQLARATIQTVPGIVWRADAHGVLDFISDACHAQLGWSPAEVMGHRWWSLVHPDDAPALNGLWVDALKTGGPIDTRYRIRNRRGGYRWHRVSAIATLNADGTIARWNGLVIEIEDLLQAQLAAESATRAKSVFLSTMTHEIRTPLNAVLGFATLLDDTDLSALQREHLHNIRTSGAHLLGVINDILDFSKLESGSAGLTYAACDVRELVETALTLVASQAGEKQLELVSRVGAEVPLACRVDGARLKQVLVNLLGNAVKFTERGTVELSVTASPLEAGDWQFEFRVRDTGIGITPNALGRLFRDFSQVDDGGARRYGGTGLGLAISKRLVEAHGGTLRAESEHGIGSTFTCCIPAQPCAAAPPVPFTVAASLRGRQVGIVEAHPGTGQMLGDLLRQWGLRVHLAPSCSALLAKLDADPSAPIPIDAVLVDHRQLIDVRALLERPGSGASATPGILLMPLRTGPPAPMPAGLRASLTKPVQRAHLQGALLEALGLSDTVTANRAGPDNPVASQDAASPLRVLLVEDNPANRTLALLLLRKLGFAHVEVAVNGLEAVDAVRETRYDLVLMDVQMPELDGLDATRQIRSVPSTRVRPQIIAMTANAQPEDRQACLDAGMDDYLSKPIESARLMQALRAAAKRLVSLG